MDQLAGFNYMYLIYAAVAATIIFIFIAVLMTYNKNCQVCTGPNAPQNSQKSTETFNSEGNAEATNEESKAMQNEANVKGEIVLYYAMWCGYSRAFLPEFEKFEKFAQEKLPHVRVNKVRCENGHEQTCSQKGVEGFPMVILYVKNGPQKVFEKERTMENLVEFVNENL